MLSTHSPFYLKKVWQLASSRSFASLIMRVSERESTLSMVILIMIHVGKQTFLRIVWEVKYPIRKL